MNKEIFIADTAARILASSYGNSTGYPRGVQESVDLAVELWDELVSRNLTPSSDGNCCSENK